MRTATAVSKHYFTVVDAWLEFKVECFEGLSQEEQGEIDLLCAGRMILT